MDNVGLCYAPTQDFWYDIWKFDLPNKFALGFCDGPPRFFGTRMKFFQHIAPRCTAIVVDDLVDDMAFFNRVRQWAEQYGYDFQILGRAGLLAKQSVLQKAA